MQKKELPTIPIVDASEFVRDSQKPHFFYPMHISQTQTGIRSIRDTPLELNIWQQLDTLTIKYINL